MVRVQNKKTPLIFSKFINCVFFVAVGRMEEEGWEKRMEERIHLAEIFRFFTR
jgi:hypothetical protein